MRFTLLMSYSEAGGAALTPEEMEAGRVEFDRYGAALHDAGVLVAAEVFTPLAAGVTIRAGEVIQATDAANSMILDKIVFIRSRHSDILH